jgi:NAD(P)-dependent dehydrogenase (short-subunit alcohol dehydrogenase family)
MRAPVVLITGALTGIGRATAVAFAKDGARVVVSGRHEEASH